MVVTKALDTLLFTYSERVEMLRPTNRPFIGAVFYTIQYLITNFNEAKMPRKLNKQIDNFPLWIYT
jgi:hypothetical protein